MDDQQKTALANSFSNVVRQTQTPGLDVQRLAMAFRMTIDALPAGQPVVELQPLYDYLVQDQKVAEQAALELCVVLKSREQKLGVAFVPAQKMAFLGEDAAQKIVGAFNAKVERSVGTWEKTGEVALPPKTTPGQQAWRPDPVAKKGKAPRNMLPVYGGILGVCVLGAIAFFAWRAQTSEPEMQEVPGTPDPAGLHCTRLTTNGTAAFCDIPLHVAQTTPREALESQAQITKRALGTGVSTIAVRTTEDQKIVVLK